MAENGAAASKVQSIDVEKLLFDLENPRFPGLHDQRSALHAFCNERHAKKTVLLAESIASVGLNPSELLIAIPAERARHYIVLEGNRRLAAMKFLAIPSRIADAPLSKPFQARLRKAAAKFKEAENTKLTCRIMSSREESNFWLSLKHTGENDGVGVVRWDGEETARFRGTSPTIKLLDLVRSKATLSTEAEVGLSYFPITNLERLLGDPDFRKALGLTLKNGDMEVTHDVAQVMQGLTQVIEDLASGNITVTNIKLKKDRAKYLKQIQSKLPSTAPLSKPVSLDTLLDDALAAPPPRPQKSVAVKRLAATRERNTLIPKSCGMEISLQKINDIYDELLRLDVNKFPNATSALLRSFIDTTTLDFASKFHLDVPRNTIGQMELKPRIEAAIQYLSRTPTEKEMSKAAKNALLQKSGPIFIENLHTHLHGRYEQAIPDNLRTGWNMIQGWMVTMWNELK